MGAAEMEELSENARRLATKLLEKNAADRLSILGAASDPFFDGLDVFMLYARPRGPDLPTFEKSSVPTADARWQKRQFSKIWSVMPSPQDYMLPDVSTTANTVAVVAETDADAQCPFVEESLTAI